jgi:RNA polymerase sigma factor (sigma-70 family)
MDDNLLRYLLRTDIPDDEWQDEVRDLPVKKLAALACLLPDNKRALIPGALSRRKWRLVFARLAKRISHGDEKIATGAFEALHFYYRVGSREYVQGKLFTPRGKNDIDDTTQDFWERLWVVARKGFKPGSQAEAWLKRILKSKVIDRVRREYSPAAKTVSVDDHVDSFVSPDHLTLQSDTEAHEAISHLPEPYRTIMRLHVLEDYSVTQTAEICGLTENQTKYKLKQARTRLRRKLMETYEQRTAKRLTISTSTKEVNHGTRL